MRDVIVVGAGTAGLAAVRDVAKHTDDFLLINDGPYGTTCARVGCMPSKVLIEAANAFHHRHRLAEFGVSGAEALRVDVPNVMRRVRRLRDDFVAGTLEATERLGAKSIAGRAKLVAPDTVEVAGQRYQARAIVLATGTSPVVPAPMRDLGKHVFTTDELFELEDLPKRLAVLGMGAIGAEMAQAAARLGLEVHAFELQPNIAGITDPEVNEVAMAALRRELGLHLGAAAELTASAGGIRVRAGASEVEVDGVLVALGRRPNVADLGLETLGVELDDRGLPPIDPATMQIGDLPVFIAGDANGQSAILHEAADEGHIAGLNAIGPSIRRFERRVPLGIVFVEPNVASVGQRFAELDEAAIVIGAVSFDRQGRARTAQTNEGLLRVYADKASGRLLGAEMAAPAGEHLAHLLALAIERRLTVAELLRLPFYHPVIEEGLRTALRAASRELPPCSDSDLAACDAFDVEALD
ncbi:MAG: dihydrolipoyl dehydrogenase [Geminicoccaceae bacterium]|nr:MAG: dihydrolipoyl dehydrogenase [Geminicoccaceae bacterium]